MEKERIKAKVSRSRRVNMFAELSAANRILLDNARKKQGGHFYEVMSCIVIAAFKFEAFPNEIGNQLFTYWDQLEFLRVENKLAIITSQLKFKHDRGRRPFQTLPELIRVRNMLAHGKPINLKEKQVDEVDTLEELSREKPLTKWERFCTIEFAKRAYEDTEKIATELWDMAKLDPQGLRQRGHGYSIE